MVRLPKTALAVVLLAGLPFCALASTPIQPPDRRPPVEGAEQPALKAVTFGTESVTAGKTLVQVSTGVRTIQSAEPLSLTIRTHGAFSQTVTPARVRVQVDNTSASVYGRNMPLTAEQAQSLQQTLISMGVEAVRDRAGGAVTVQPLGAMDPAMADKLRAGAKLAERLMLAGRTIDPDSPVAMVTTADLGSPEPTFGRETAFPVHLSGTAVTTDGRPVAVLSGQSDTASVRLYVDEATGVPIWLHATTSGAITTSEVTAQVLLK